MTTLLVIVWILFTVLLVATVAVRPKSTRSSWFELKQRDDQAAMRRERLLGDVYALRRLVTLLLFVVLTSVTVVLWQWWAALAMLLTVLLVIPVTRIPALSRRMMRVYDRNETSILRFVEKWLIVGWFGRYERFSHREPKLESVEQLRHLVETSGHILSEQQQNIIHHGLDWHETSVASIMTARSNVASVKRSELLGPLVLDDLHKTGHSRFPVTRGNLDTIIGVLDITGLLEVTASKTSQTAEMAMSPQALRIESNKPLPMALDLLQKSRGHMLVVIDKDGKTAGIVTLADITGSLLGKTGVK